MLAFPVLRKMPPDITEAEKLTWSLEKADGWDRYWRRQKFAGIPDAFALPVAKVYREVWEKEGEQPANLYLLGISESLGNLAIDVNASDDDLVVLAKNIAAKCRRALATRRTQAATALHLIRFCNRYGIRPPPKLQEYGNRCGISNGSGISIRNRTANSAVSVSGTDTVFDDGPLDRGTVARLGDDTWWRRKLRAAHGRLLEATAIHLHQVHRYAGCYISDAGLDRKQQQVRRNKRVIASLVAENEEGETFNLEEVIEGSLANPKNRRAELMVRIHGFDTIAQDLGHVAVLLTVTCPSRMHSHLGKTGAANGAFDPNMTPRIAQQYLAKIWSRIRAKWQRLGIRPYGFRITEPHHDGTPHWHILLFIEPSNLNAMLEAVRHHALADSPDEKGAKEHRFRVEFIDHSKGSATGYVAKYISKNVDGYGLGKDEKHGVSSSGPERVRAWASTWGIRQFQQIGGAPVGLWREFRRVPQFGESDSLVGVLAKAADEGRWGDFVMALGGPQADRATLPISIEKYTEQRLGRYGEPLGLRIAGIKHGNVVFSTRFHTWVIKRKSSAQNCTPEQPQIAMVADGGDFAERSVAPLPPWSTVNNCTGINEKSFRCGH